MLVVSVLTLAWRSSSSSGSAAFSSARPARPQTRARLNATHPATVFLLKIDIGTLPRRHFTLAVKGSLHHIPQLQGCAPGALAPNGPPGLLRIVLPIRLRLKLPLPYPTAL